MNLLFCCHPRILLCFYTVNYLTLYVPVVFPLLFLFRNLLPISHVCIEDGEKPMVLLPFMAWGNLKLFLRQCKLAEANNPQVKFRL